jgi:hypothetical protein
MRSEDVVVGGLTRSLGEMASHGVGFWTNLDILVAAQTTVYNAALYLIEISAKNRSKFIAGTLVEALEASSGRTWLSVVDLY